MVTTVGYEAEIRLLGSDSDLAFALPFLTHLLAKPQPALSQKSGWSSALGRCPCLESLMGRSFRVLFQRSPKCRRSTESR